MLMLLFLNVTCAFSAALAVMAFEFVDAEELRHSSLLYLLWFGKGIMATYVYRVILEQFNQAITRL